MTIRIHERDIGPGHPAYIIAEMSANHLGSYDQAVAIVRAAARGGADAIKLQTYDADSLTIDADQSYFKIGAGTPWEGQDYYQLYQNAHMPWEWHRPLMELADELGIHCFSSPSCARGVDFLEGLNVPAYKVASFELVDLGLIEKVASTGKPVILSTGMATPEEIQLGIDTALAAGAAGVAILKCTSSYPAPVDAANLVTIPAMADRFQVPVGLSDHTLEDIVVTTGVTLGACIVEKHLTISRSDGGPDADFSLEPEELRRMVDAVRTAESAAGQVQFGVGEAEQVSIKFRRSLFAVEDIPKGTSFSSANVRSIRPGDGLPPRHLKEVLGRMATEDIARGTPLAWELIE